MREGVLVAYAMVLAGCPAAEEGAGCPTEHLVESAEVAGSQILVTADRVVWTEESPAEIRLDAKDGSSGTTSGLAAFDIFGFDRGMALDGSNILWTARLDGATDSALFSTEPSGITTMLVTFPGCEAPSGVAVDGGAWWVGVRCAGEASVRTGSGATESAAYPVPGLRDVAAGAALTEDGIVVLDPPSTLAVPQLSPRRFARGTDYFYVVGNDQLYAVPADGSEPQELGRNMLGATELVVDDAAAYIASDGRNDTAMWRVPLDGTDPRTDAEVIAENLGSELAIAQDATHVYWVTRGRLEQKGVWRVEKCR